jgi:5'-nucleotidase
MGDDKDIKFASENSGYDMIVGGHTHMRVDTLVGKTSIGQTERLLSLLGVTRIRLKGNKVVSLDYENISFDGYAEDSATREIVDRIENDPVLGAVVGQLADSVTHTGFANMVTKVVAKATKADIGFYHYGGIRLRKHAAGDIKLATVYNLEPFESKIHTIMMTPAQMRRMIITKFNDTKNSKESHRVDLFSTTPYTIIVDERGEATDVLFPKLRENRKYRVALSDYVGKKYEDIKGENHTKHDILVVDQLLKYLKESPVTPIDNQPHQKIVKR